MKNGKSLGPVELKRAAFFRIIVLHAALSLTNCSSSFCAFLS